jgi:CRISPR-associated protein Cas1
VATVSGLILGPGTSITHSAVKAAAQCNHPLFLLGEGGLRFYAFGITLNHDNSMARIHASAWVNKKPQNEISRRMFLHRFPEASVHGVKIKQLRGMEGKRVKLCYADLYKHETSWPAAFEALSIDPQDDGTLVRKLLYRTASECLHRYAQRPHPPQSHGFH